MSALKQRWLLGRGITNKSITPLTLGSDNTFTAGVTVSLEGKLEDYRYNFEGSNENISPIDSQNMNEVIVEDGVAMDFREIMRWGVPSDFETLLLSYDYFRVAWTQGGYNYVYEGIRRPGCGPDFAKGKNLFRLALGPIALSTGGNLTRTAV